MRAIEAARRAHRGGDLKALTAGFSPQEMQLCMGASLALATGGSIPQTYLDAAAKHDSGPILPDPDTLLQTHQSMAAALAAEELGGKPMARMPGADDVAATHVASARGDLRPVLIKELVRGVNVGVVLTLTTIAPAVRFSATQLLGRDAAGAAVVLSVYNLVPDGGGQARAQSYFPEGTRLVVREPYLKQVGDGTLALRCDNPGNVLITRPGRAMPRVPLGEAPTAAAERLKAAGNARVSAKEWHLAEDAYTAALEVLLLGGDISGGTEPPASPAPPPPVQAPRAASTEDLSVLQVALLSNRAHARLQQRLFDGALADCDAALALAPGAPKPAYRRGLALLGLRRYGQAVEALQSCAEDSDPVVTAALERARTGAAQAKGRWDFRTMPFEPDAQLAAPTADYVGPVAIKPTRDGRGWGLFVTRDVAAGELLLVENALALGWDDPDAPTLAANFAAKQSTTGGHYKLTAELVRRAHTDGHLRAQLAMLAWQRSAGGGREPGAVPPAMDDVRSRALPPHEAQLSAARIAGVTDVNTFSFAACVRAADAARAAVHDALLGGRTPQPPHAALDDFRPVNDVGRAVLAPWTSAQAVQAAIDALPPGRAERAAALNAAEPGTGWAPLHYAVLQRVPADVIAALLAAGADPNLPDTRTLTPLHLYFSTCSPSDDTAVVGALLDGGASLTSSTDDGATPLHLAAIVEHADAARLLLARGADPYAPDLCGTPAAAMAHGLVWHGGLADKASVPKRTPIAAAFDAAGHTLQQLEQHFRRGSALWFVGSYMNHAAQQSSLRTFVGQLLVVRAAAALRAGAEVTTRYSSDPAVLAKWGIRE